MATPWVSALLKAETSFLFLHSSCSAPFLPIHYLRSITPECSRSLQSFLKVLEERWRWVALSHTALKGMLRCHSTSKKQRPLFPISDSLALPSNLLDPSSLLCTPTGTPFSKLSYSLHSIQVETLHPGLSTWCENCLPPRPHPHCISFLARLVWRSPWGIHHTACLVLQEVFE